MIAMQYSFTFPADYDMNIIRKRVREKGTALDKHEPLIFKAYLIVEKDDVTTGSRENMYAPFYLWKNTQGMTDFLTGNGFKGLVNSFGQPSVINWPCIINYTAHDNLFNAKYATKTITQISSYVDFVNLKQEMGNREISLKEKNACLAHTMMFSENK